MLGFLKKLLGAKPAQDNAEVPYKVEAPVAVVPPTSTVSDFPFPKPQEEKPVAKKTQAKKPAGEKKPAVKAKTARTKKKAS